MPNPDSGATPPPSAQLQPLRHHVRRYPKTSKLPPAIMDPATPPSRQNQNSNYVPLSNIDKGFCTGEARLYDTPSNLEKGFWTRDGYVSNKDLFFTNSSTPPLASGYVSNTDHFFSNSSKPEYKHSREWLANGFDSYLLHSKRQAVEAPIINQQPRINFSGSLPWDNASIFRSSPNQISNNSSMSKKMVTFNQFQHSYGGFEKFRDGWVKDPRSGWCTYVGGSEKAIIPMESQPCDKGGELVASVGSVGFNAKCLGSHQDVANALSKPVSSYSLLYEQSPVQTPKTPTKLSSDIVSVSRPHKTPKSRQESANKIKAAKKVAKKTAAGGLRTDKRVSKKKTRGLPTNVKSLLATGMFDGLPVRYVTTSHEVLPGIIEGVSYVCGCQSCNYAKALNAYEFERHAGCKTNHPNNRICFENGKSVHQVVQELKVTPRTMLFESVQIIVGAPVNQTAFQAWKESFQAATCKRQGTYAAEEEPKL